MRMSCAMTSGLTSQLSIHQLIMNFSNPFMRRIFYAGALLLSSHVAFSQRAIPPLDNKRVHDDAQILSTQTVQQLELQLKQYEDSTSNQIAILIIPSLDGDPIEEYALRVAHYNPITKEGWGLGQEKNDNGVLLLIAVDDHKMRIEVGYGLEPLLTDALSSVIINTQIVPRFKAGDFTGGINAGADAVITQLKLTPEEAAKRAKEAVAASQDGESIGTAIFWLFILFFFVLPMFFGRGKRGNRFGGGPVIIWGGGDSSGGWSSGGSSSWGGGGGFSGGGGGFGGGGASGGW